jgi:sister chromatid cohesion protein DCC1
MSEEERSSKRARREGVHIASSTETCEIQFSSELAAHSKKYRLFEVPKSFYEELKAGSSRIVGDDNSDAVICSISKTYSIKKVETSNSVYLAKSSDSKIYNLESLHHEYYEVAVVSPKLEKLEQWLRMSLYTGAKQESAFVKAKLVTFDTLKETIQASDIELLEALKAIGTIEVDGELLTSISFPCRIDDRR